MPRQDRPRPGLVGVLVAAVHTVHRAPVPVRLSARNVAGRWKHTSANALRLRVPQGCRFSGASTSASRTQREPVRRTVSRRGSVTVPLGCDDHSER